MAVSHCPACTPVPERPTEDTENSHNGEYTNPAEKGERKELPAGLFWRCWRDAWAYKPYMLHSYLGTSILYGDERIGREACCLRYHLKFQLYLQRVLLLWQCLWLNTLTTQSVRVHIGIGGKDHFDLPRNF